MLASLSVLGLTRLCLLNSKIKVVATSCAVLPQSKDKEPPASCYTSDSLSLHIHSAQFPLLGHLVPVLLALLCKASTPQPIPTLEIQQQYARSDTPPLKFTLDDVIHAIRSSVHFSREPEGDTLEETEALLPQLSSPLPVT